MDEYDSLQYSGLLYSGSNHKTHDNFWMQPGFTSAYFCFACGVELIEDKTVLHIKKKKILTEMLEIFINNDMIWKLLCGKRNVIHHILDVFVSLLSQSNDDELTTILNECFLLITQRTSPEHTAEMIIGNIVSISNFSTNEQLMKIIGNILHLVPSVSATLLQQHQRCFFDEILNSAKQCSIENLKSYLTIILEVLKSDYNEKIQKSNLRSIISLCVEFSKMAIDFESEKLIIEIIASLADKSSHHKILCEYESSKFTSSTQSIIETLKKLLLSKNEDLQILTINCISVMSDPKFNNHLDEFTTLIKIILEKGFSELLLELLSLSNDKVMPRIFSCLSNLVESKIYTKGGHMIFGFSTIIKAIKKACYFPNNEALIHGMVVLKTILQKKSDLVSHENFSEMLDLFFSGLQKNENKVIFLIISSLLALLRQIKNANQSFTCRVLDILSEVCLYVEKEIAYTKTVEQDKLTFICEFYEAALTLIQVFNRLMHGGKDEKVDSSFERSVNSCTGSTTQHDISTQETALIKEDSLENLIEGIYFLGDKYFISQAVAKFLPLKNIEFQTIFYQYLLALLELNSTNGEKIASKLAESSFFYMIHEFKIIASRASLNLDNILGKLLLYLCLSIEKRSLSESMKKKLFTSLKNFNMPFDEWKLLLTSALKDAAKQFEFITENRMSALALLAYSHKSGQSIMPLQYLKPHFHNFLALKNVLRDLPILGKRYVIYLWGNIEMSVVDMKTFELQARQNLIDTVEREKDNWKDIFMVSEILVCWMFRIGLSVPAQKCILGLYIKEYPRTAFENLIKIVAFHGHFQDFMEILLLSISTCSNKESSKDFICLYELSVLQVDRTIMKGLVFYINRIFLLTADMNYNNVSLLYKCLNILLINDNDELNETYMKLFCQALTFIANALSPVELLTLVNYCYLVLRKISNMQNVVPLSIISGKGDVLKEFQKTVFLNEHIIRNCISSSLAEQLNSSVILLMAEIVHKISFTVVTVEEPIKMYKHNFIEVLAIINLPLLQISALTLWKSLFEVKCKSSILKMVNEDKIICSLTQNDIQLILTRLQNLMVNNEDIIKNSALNCFQKLIENIENKEMILKHAWNRKIESIALQHLFTEKFDILFVKYLTIMIPFLNYSPKVCDMIMKFILSFIASPDDFSGIYELINFTQEVTKLWLLKIDFKNLKSLKSSLFDVESILNQNASILEDSQGIILDIIYLSGVAYDRSSRKGETTDIFEKIRKIRKNLEERIIQIEEGETDSENEEE